MSAAVQVTGRSEAGSSAIRVLASQANLHHWWDITRAGYEPHYRVISLDYRGTGTTRGELGPGSIADSAEDAVDVLQSLELRTVAVHGTSMRGVAQRLAIEYPELVSALVLTCTTPSGEHGIERDETTPHY